MRSFGVELLDAVVAGIGHIHVAAPVHADALGRCKLTVAGACRDRDWAYARTLADRLDTAVRDELGRWLYETICTLADAPREPEDIDEQDLMDALRDNLSPQAVAAVVAYLQPAKTDNAEVNRQLRWLAERLTELVGGPEQLARLTDELGL